jgi:hypothetical protein
LVAWIAPTSSAEVVSDVISHCAATVCIQLPMLDTRLANHHRRKLP